jgi:hypothetical protein
VVLKAQQRCVWREEFETLDEARVKIERYIDRYPCEVAATWKYQDQLTPAA